MAERAYKRPYRTGIGYTAEPGKTRRVKRQPQTPYNPLDIHRFDLIKPGVDRLPDEFVVHRRGPRRADVGSDYQESRAVSHSRVRGSLPERIYYRKNIEYNLYPGTHFTFQSSQDGGRMEVGGMVADFIYPIWRVIVQVQGPTHDTPEGKLRDKQQGGRLADMGYVVYTLDDDVIYNEMALDLWFRGHILNRPNLGMQQTMVGTLPQSFSNVMTPQERVQLAGIEDDVDLVLAVLEAIDG